MRRPTHPLIIMLLTAAPACVPAKIQAIIDQYDTFGSTGASSTSTGTTVAPSDTTTTDANTDSTTSSTSGTDGADGTASTTTSLPPDETDTDTTSTTPAPICGDGIQDPDEECDDANQNDADGCLPDCTREWIVFITSNPVSQGDLKGLVGADYQCRHRATKIGLTNGERYMAWISTSTVQPIDRLYHARGPYKLINGLRVAANWDALVTGPLENPINVTELGETNNNLVFTGTNADGTRIADSTRCNDWTDIDGKNTSWIGASEATDADWTRALEGPCGGGAALYCFEQP